MTDNKPVYSYARHFVNYERRTKAKDIKSGGGGIGGGVKRCQCCCQTYEARAWVEGGAVAQRSTPAGSPNSLC